MNLFKKKPEFTVTVAEYEIPVYFDDEIALKMHKAYTEGVFKRAKVKPKYFCVEHSTEMIWIAMVEGWKKNRKTLNKPFPFAKEDFLYMVNVQEYVNILLQIQRFLPTAATFGSISN